MTRLALIALLVASITISMTLIIGVVRSSRTPLDKAWRILLLLVPVAGPLLYWLIYSDTPLQPQHLQNRGPRGHYAHTWIAIKPILEQGLRGRADDQSQKNGDHHDK
jgi:hypothetical protein